MKREYYLLTIQRPNEDVENIWYEGNLTTFLLIEKSLGRNTVILNHLIINKEEHDYALQEIKRYGA